MDTNNLPSHLHPNVSADGFFQAVLRSFIKNESNAASVILHYEVICKGVPLDAVLKVDITLDRLEVEKNVWIDWKYTPENPFPKLPEDYLVHVKFADESTSISDGSGARPLSYWHNDGNANYFEWSPYIQNESQIIAYMILDPNDHD